MQRSMRVQGDTLWQCICIMISDPTSTQLWFSLWNATSWRIIDLDSNNIEFYNMICDYFEAASELHFQARANELFEWWNMWVVVCISIICYLQRWNYRQIFGRSIGRSVGGLTLDLKKTCDVICSCTILFTECHRYHNRVYLFGYISGFLIYTEPCSVYLSRFVRINFNYF